MKAKNYVGTKIGKFKILEQFSKNAVVYLKTKCTLCGKIAWVAQKHIASRKCCEGKSDSTQFKALDLIGKTINGITLLEKTNRRNGNMIVWKCKCYCGNIFYAAGCKIKSGEISSCGCLKNPTVSEEIRRLAFSSYSEKYLKDGTNLSVILSNKMLSTNSSGVKGVFYDKSKKRWVANLIFQKKSHRRCFKNKEDAIKCRQEWEKEYFEPILKKYAKKEVN
nr:MAG TPA: hypothetical protein [Bacteriophage sp.]